MQSKKRKPVWYKRRGVRQFFSVLLVLMLIAVFALSALPIAPLNIVPPTATNALAFPEVPLGGTPVVVTGTYFHPSGVFSVPSIRDWDKPADNPDETLLPSATSKVSRAGTTFINSAAASVAHVFVETDPDRTFEKIQDLDAYYTYDRLRDAWARYTGGFKELSRNIVGAAIVIDFEIYFEGQPYLGRQITELAADWIKVMRLVAPNNNAALLDQLQAVIQPEFRFWSGALAAPLNWVTLMDTGYMVRYPPDWRQVDGSPGQPYTLTAQRGEDIITMTAQIYEGAPLTTTENAQAWVLSKWPRALVETTAAESRGETTGFSVSFLNRDADGNQRSMLVTVLNGSDNRLYTLTVQLNSGTRNLLADSTIPELFQVRSAFLLVPVGLTTQQSPTPTSAG